MQAQPSRGSTLSPDDNLSNEDDNHSISLMLGQSDSDKQAPRQSVGVDCVHDAATPGLYRSTDTATHVANPEHSYLLHKISNNVLIIFK